MTASPNRICTICSLLCPVDGPFGPNQGRDCTLRTNWLTRHGLGKPTQASQLSGLMDRHQSAVRSAKQPLIWVDGCDVETMRSAVKLAQVWQASIVVSKPRGAKHITSITCNDGWLGTTLADAARHSQLVIALGDGWRSGLPRLKERFFGHCDELVWWDICDSKHNVSTADCSDKTEDQSGGRSRIAPWPRNRWYSQFSHLTQQIRSNQPADEDGLLQAILKSQYTTILWDKSELSLVDDEFVVYQLNQLASLRSQTARCSLLPLDENVGTDTASAVLLWLTGCSDIATFKQNSWTSPSHFQHYSTSDWNAEFDFVVRISNTVSRQMLSGPKANLHICHASLDDSNASSNRVYSDNNSSQHICVGTAGVDHDSILFRGDHGMTCFAPADDQAFGSTASSDASQSDASTISAWRVLDALRSLISDQSRGDQ